MGKKSDGQHNATNGDAAKLFFDSFSKRVGGVEEGLRSISLEFERLKLSVERGQISDLVLLERLQKSEELLRESLSSIKAAVENQYGPQRFAKETSSTRARVTLSEKPIETAAQTEPMVASRVLTPTGELGSLSSITTPTELQVLTILANEGPTSAPEIGRAIGRSREHTARLMKKLFEDGYIRRDQARVPFRYSLVDKVKLGFKKAGPRDEAREAISIPQT